MLRCSLLCFGFRGNFQEQLYEFCFVRLAGIQNSNPKDLIFRCFSLFQFLSHIKLQKLHCTISFSVYISQYSILIEGFDSNCSKKLTDCITLPRKKNLLVLKINGKETMVLICNHFNTIFPFVCLLIQILTFHFKC